ncbi:hypothetical protein [Nonomuraea sp. NPDC048826]|uniref:hypothetical protein n=1 Tax=Nonomuraea sp. NPDC048826 TaxID=3364347 RepID=UPI00371B65A5
MMPDLATIAVQTAVGIVPLGAAWFAYRASTDANRRTAETAERQALLELSKVDSEAFERARAIYDSGISLLERQLARVQTQFDQLSADSAAERDGLQRRIRTMQAQIEGLESTVVLLRRQLIEAGIAPAARPFDRHDTPEADEA